jgi:hypothetical protein
MRSACTAIIQKHCHYIVKLQYSSSLFVKAGRRVRSDPPASQSADRKSVILSNDFASFFGASRNRENLTAAHGDMKFVSVSA